MSANGWAKTYNLWAGYWPYAVYAGGTLSRKVVHVRGPFGIAIAKAKGSVPISALAELQVQQGGGR